MSDNLEEVPRINNDRALSPTNKLDDSLRMADRAEAVVMSVEFKNDESMNDVQYVQPEIQDTPDFEMKLNDEIEDNQPLTLEQVDEDEQQDHDDHSYEPQNNNEYNNDLAADLGDEELALNDHNQYSNLNNDNDEEQAQEMEQVNFPTFENISAYDKVDLDNLDQNADQQNEDELQNFDENEISMRNLCFITHFSQSISIINYKF